MLKPFADSVRDIVPGTPTWRTWLGLAAVPLLVVSLLTAAFWAPQRDHGTARAAVVNQDRPVTIDERIIPLGRELAGRLTQGEDSPYKWVLTDAADAREGVADGTYKAVVTIPEGFSAAATSPATAAPLDATQGTLRIQTSRATDILDPVATRQIAKATLDTLGRQIVETYLDNIYIAFTTIHDRLNQAADGAESLAEGTGRVATGARDLSAGADSLASAADRLAAGADQLAGGAGRLSTGADQLAGGAARLATGTGRLAAGSGRLSAGLDQAERDTADLPALTQRLAEGARQVANGNRRLADTVTPIADEVIRVIDKLPPARSTAARLRRLAAQCTSSGGAPAFCGALTAAAERFAAQAPALDALLARIRAAAVSAKTDLDALATGAENVAEGNARLAAGSRKLAAGIADAARGARDLDAGVRQVDGAANRLAAGADRLAGGAGELAGGADELAGGADRLADGADRLAAGGHDLAGGARRTDAGATKLAAELDRGRDQVPSYTARERAHLTEVAAAPAIAVTAPASLHGKAAVPLFAVLALWSVALATYVVIRPVPPHALTTRTPTWALTLHAAIPGAAIAVIAASALSLLLAPFLHLDPGRWFALLAVALLAALAFVAVNQAVVAIFKRPGRLVSLAVLVLTLATGVISTMPPFFADAEPLLPTAGAIQAVRAVITGAGGGWRGMAMLLVWAAAGTVATIVITHRSRTVSGRRLRPGGGSGEIPIP